LDQDKLKEITPISRDCKKKMIDTNEEQPTMPQATKSSKVNPMT
jgi:hypothetical protein